MEMINSRQSNLPTKQPEWALAIKSHYGEFDKFSVKFSPKIQRYCATNLRRAIEQGVPSFARIITTYGKERIVELISIHVLEMIVSIGEDKDADRHDARFIAEAICDGERFRHLRFTSVLGFFHLLKCGEFEIYGRVTPRKVLEHFRKYADATRDKEDAIMADIEKQEERKELESKHTISWEQYAASRGIPDKSLTDYLIRMSK